MNFRKTESLTQDELIAELDDCGYGGITKRQIANWRKNHLLPSFDFIGSGLGKKLGREPNFWSNGQQIVQQSVWVCRLLEIYGNFDSLYLPLWALGYEIPLSCVRESLAEPLKKITDEISEKAIISGHLEDYIGDEIYEGIKRAERIKKGTVQLPQEAFEAFMNIFLNPEYSLNDYPFEKGMETLKEWQNNSFSSKGNGRDNLFDQAPFFKQYLSLHQLKQAVDKATDDDFMLVKRDLEILRDILSLIYRMFLKLAVDLPNEFRTVPENLLGAIFGGARLLVLANLSLRRNGFSEKIDFFILEASRRFQDEINQKLDRELTGIAQKFSTAIKQSLEELEGSFSI
jgi:hypothetical protein